MFSGNNMKLVSNVFFTFIESSNGGRALLYPRPSKYLFQVAHHDSEGVDDQNHMRVSYQHVWTVKI